MAINPRKFNQFRLISGILATLLCAAAMPALAQTAPADPAKKADAKKADEKKADEKKADEKKAAPAAGTNTAPDRPDGAAPPPADGAPADPNAPDAAPPAAPPPPPPPGFVVITVDTEGLSAVVGGEVHGLKKGDNRFELPAGPTTIDVQGKDGKSIQKFPVTIASGQDSKVSVAMTGAVVVNGPQLSVAIDGKDVPSKDGAATAQLLKGKHSVVVTQPGRVGIKSQIEVLAGKTHTISPSLANFDAGDKRVAWASVLGGGGLILAAVFMERFADANSFGGDATRWIMVGGGIAGFAGGTIMMKNILKREVNPPVKDGTLDVQVSRANSGTTASVAAR